MVSKLIAQGAEAKIYLKNNWITKDRIKKSYRIPELDEKIRKRRTKSEAKLLTKASKIIHSPLPFFEPDNSYQIKMPFINGKKLSEHLDNFSLAKQKQILKQIGESVAKLHNNNIIHGDLTTSNMIYAPSKKDSIFTKRGDGSKDKVFFVDFGLGFQNPKYEDKAVDIHLLKQALEAKHFKNWKTLYKEFEKAYSSINKTEAEKVLAQLIKVEKRGRYKS